jgi:hypothetical protein
MSSSSAPLNVSSVSLETSTGAEGVGGGVELAVVDAVAARAAVKAVACELPVRYGLALGRFSRTELYRLVIECAITEASASTIWRWLHEDAIKPWQQRCWIYRRDPQFAPKAGRALDLYGRTLMSTSSPRTRSPSCRRSAATTRRALPERAAPRAMSSSTSEAARSPTWPRGMCITRTCSIASSPRPGIEPFGRLVEQVMTSEPYASARTVYWIVDNGSSHAGKTSIKRIQDRSPNARLIHLPAQGSSVRRRAWRHATDARRRPTRTRQWRAGGR